MLVKPLIKKGLATLGYDIRKIVPPNSPDFPIDEMLPVKWQSEALQMSNRFFRPLLRLIHDAGYSTVSVLGKDLQNNAPHITSLRKREPVQYPHIDFRVAPVASFGVGFAVRS